MGVLDFLFGSKGKFKQLPTMTEGQQGLLSQLLGGLGGQGGSLGMGMGNLQRLLGGDTEAFEAPAMRQFQEQIIPGIAERFTGMGAGAQQSSAFGQQLGAAGAGLAEQLAAMRGGLQQQAMGQLMQLLQSGLGARSFENVYKPGTQGFLGTLGAGLSQGFGGALGGGFGNWLNMVNPKPYQYPYGGTMGPYGTWSPGQYNMYTGQTI